MAMLTGGEILARGLADQGVDTIFGLPGDQLMHALDGLAREPRIRFVTTRHEQGTTYLADGYARASGRVGVALVVPGVGVYNAAAGLATAYATSSPVLLVAGQVRRDGIGRGLGLLHDVHDQLDLVRPITKWCQRIPEAHGIASGLEEAFRQLRSGRPQPVEVEFPPEALAESAPWSEKARVEVDPVTGDPDLVARAADWLARAERPLVLAGGGVAFGEASASLTAVAEQLQAAVVTTREGKGSLDARHPLYVGTMWNNPRLLPVMRDADVVLAVGTRGQGTGIEAGQQVIQIDADPAELGRLLPLDLGIEGHAAPTLDLLRDELDARISTRPSRAAEVSSMREKVENGLRAVGPQASIVESLREGLPEDVILVAGTTTVGYMCHMHFPAYGPRSYLGSSYMGTLGFAFPVALGAKVARPERPVVSVIGDGGFLFAASELATAVQHEIACVTVVFDDGAYGNSNREQHESFEGREIGTLLRNPNFADLARSFGAEGVNLSGPEQLVPALREALSADAPVVIACPIPRMPSPF
ncbi:thiamine pyrophosphate-dependent enzyme [Myxococcota bacterium]|nr:thiamine pyrophosphate-dependent enzyme [Myxococcota bacterium]